MITADMVRAAQEAARRPARCRHCGKTMPGGEMFAHVAGEHNPGNDNISGGGGGAA